MLLRPKLGDLGLNCILKSLQYLRLTCAVHQMEKVQHIIFEITCWCFYGLKHGRFTHYVAIFGINLLPHFLFEYTVYESYPTFLLDRYKLYQELRKIAVEGKCFQRKKGSKPLYLIKPFFFFENQENM